MSAPAGCRAGCGSAPRSRARSRPRTGRGNRSRRIGGERRDPADRPCRGGCRPRATRAREPGGSTAGSDRREARVDDVLHQEHVAVLQIDLDVQEDPHAPERLLGLAVAADRHEPDLERQVDGRHQVREEHRAALEDRDQHGLPPRVVPGDRGAELLDPAADVLAPEQDARDLRHRTGSLASVRRRREPRASIAVAASAGRPVTTSRRRRRAPAARPPGPARRVRGRDRRRRRADTVPSGTPSTSVSRSVPTFAPPARRVGGATASP